MHLLQDCRFAIRLLFKEPGFAAVVIITLALGIGMNAAMFTLVNGVLIRGLPFEEADRIMYIGERDTRNGRNFGASWADFQDWRNSQKSFADLAAWAIGTMNVSDEGKPAERYNGAYLTANAFKVFRVRPVVGRDFNPGDDGAGAPVAVLGYAMWKSRYGMDPAIVGRVIRINAVPVTIVGVMPEAMKFPDADLWIPLSQNSGLREQSR